jgi:hypothetical protein
MAHSKYIGLYSSTLDGIRNARLLQNLGLPGNLINLIVNGQLHDAIDEAYERVDELNKMLDDWEEHNPGMAKLLPWYQARQEWKAAGRPKPEWYQVLSWENRRAVTKSLSPRDIDYQLTHETVKPYRINYRKPIGEGRPWLYGKTHPK